MKLSTLVLRFADALNVPVPVVRGYARALREAGMISTGGRGPGGEEMTEGDFFHLFIGLMGSRYAKDVAERVTVLNGLIERTRKIVGSAESVLPIDLTLRNLLAHLFRDASDVGMLDNWAIWAWLEFDLDDDVVVFQAERTWLKPPESNVGVGELRLEFGTKASRIVADPRHCSICRSRGMKQVATIDQFVLPKFAKILDEAVRSTQQGPKS